MRCFSSADHTDNHRPLSNQPVVSPFFSSFAPARALPPQCNSKDIAGGGECTGVAKTDKAKCGVDPSVICVNDAALDHCPYDPNHAHGPTTERIFGCKYCSSADPAQVRRYFLGFGGLAVFSGWIFTFYRFCQLSLTEGTESHTHPPPDRCTAPSHPLSHSDNPCSARSRERLAPTTPRPRARTQ